MNRLYIILTACLLIVQVAQAQAPTNGLVAYYPFNGNAQDASGNGNHGTVNGATLTTDRRGNVNSAYAFNGSNNITALSSGLPVGNSPRTFSLWVNSSQVMPGINIGTPAGLLEYGQRSTFLSCNIVMWGNALRFSNWSSPPDMDYYFDHPINQWFHVVVSLDQANNAKFYINGEVKYTSSVETWNTSSIGNLLIGQTFPNGKVDDVRIYNRALSDIEVQALFHAEDPPIDIATGLVAHYKMDGNAQDASGNSNHGTAQNGVNFGTDRFGSAGKAASFDGVDDKISAPHSSSIYFSNTQPYTLTIWMFATSNTQAFMFLKNANYGLQWNGSTNAIAFYNGNYHHSTKNNWILNQWYQLTFIDNGNDKVSLYVNGVLDKVESPNPSRFGTYPIEIGKWEEINQNYFNGKLDDIRIYNRALSDAEVLALYNSESSGVSLTTAMRLGGGLSTLNVGTSYNLTASLKNNGSASWVGDVYLKVKGGIPTLVSSNNVISAGDTYNVSSTFSPQTSQIGQNVSVELLTKQGTNDFVRASVVNGTVNPISVNIEAASSVPVVKVPFTKADKMSYLPNEIITLTGGNFKPYTTIFFRLDPEFTSYAPFVTARADGSFDGTITIPSIFSSKSVKVLASDIYGNKPSTDILEVLQPNESINISISRPVIQTSNPFFNVTRSSPTIIEWNDKMLPASIYPQNGASRNYKYMIIFKNTLNQEFRIKEISGTLFLNQTIKFTESLILDSLARAKISSVNFISGQLIIKDMYNPVRIAATPLLNFILDTAPSSEANLVWDKSFGTIPNSPITGICADGVSRVYIRVKGNISSNTIQSVNITLSDKTFFTNTNWLGKVMYASNQNNNTYNEEANTASSISKTSTIISNNNEYWFWYVAPMDFQRDNFVFADSSERKVTANITINYQNNTSETIKYPITIVRPPLMLVHGLGGSGYFNEESTWGNFKLLTGINKDLFKNPYAPQMYGNRSFEDNANVLLGKDPTKFSSSFQYVISTMRKQGYVCNQVDYICHSMGGNMMRYITSFKDDEFKVGIEKGNVFQKNYGKGWVHKFISINTPYNGSPGADLITGMTPLLNKTATGWVDVAYSKFDGTQTYVELTGYSPTGNKNIYAATQAVKNLTTNKLTGGVIFKSQTLPSHLIASDFYTGNTYSSDVASNISSNFVGNLKPIANYFITIGNQLVYPSGLSTSTTLFAEFIKQNQLSLAGDWLGAISTVSAINALNKTFTKWGNYNQKYSEQMWNSDLVVPTMSQTANLPLSSPNVTLVQNDDTFDFKVFHIGVQDSPKVSERVKFLLNQEVSSSYFGNIPANNNIQANTISNSLNASLNSINVITYIDKIDTTKLKIITPTLNTKFDYESIITIKSLVKDTIGLKKVELYYNGNRFVDSTKSVVSTFLTDGIKQNGLHKITVVANYFRDDTLMLIRDTTQVLFNTAQTISKFKITPHLKICSIGEIHRPTYNLFFGNFISNFIDFSKLSVSISNPSCLSYNIQTGQFKGSQKGEAVVIFTYDGIFKDTMYVAVGGGGIPYTQQISTSNVPVKGDGTICTGATISIPFSTTGGVFDEGNQYIVQLSDAGGENFITLETTGTSSPLTARIPNGLPNADTYKIRVVSTSPPVIGTSAVQSLKIRNQDATPITSLQSGNWSSPTTWSCGRVPSGNDVVVIEAGHTVTMPLGTYPVRRVTQRGTLQYSNGSVLQFTE